VIKAIKKKIKRAYFGFRVRIMARSVGCSPKINAITKVTDKTTLGDNFNSNGLLVIGKGEVEIGDNFHCGFGCIIITENHKFKNADKVPYGNEYDVRNTVIGDNVWLGINVTLLPGVEIGEGAIIQAGSVVTKSIPPLSIAGGHPSTVFSARDSFQYYDLKGKGLVH